MKNSHHMRKLFLCLLCFITFYSNNLMSQVTVSYASGNVNMGEDAEIDVTVSDFEDITGMGFTVTFDDQVFTYSGVTNVITSLDGFNMDVFGDGADGKLSVSWFNGIQGFSLSDNSVLFTIILNGVGEPCSSTELSLGDDPTEIEFIDFNTISDIGYNVNNGTVMINGTDCGGGGGDDLTINIPMVDVEEGEEFCISITADNFIDIEAAQGSFNWDPAVIQFSSMTSSHFTGWTVLDGDVADGNIRFLWFDNSGMNPITLADGDELIELCFEAVGNVGDMSSVSFTDNPLAIEFNDGSVVDPVVINNGKVTIAEVVSDPVRIICSDETGNDGDNVCVMFTVEDFENVNGVGGTILYDPAFLDWTGAQSFGLPGLDEMDFNETSSGTILISWTTNNGNPITEDDGEKIFELCFDIINDDCPEEEVSVIDITDLEVSNETMAIPSEAVDGSITIGCVENPCVITEVRVDDVLCFGESTGNIIVEIDPGDYIGCECVWFKNGTQLPSTSIDNCSLTSIGAGNYELEVSCDGNKSCDMSFVVEEPDAALSVDGTKTDAGCEDDGSIDVSIAGGTANYTITWLPAGSIADGETNPTGLEPGTYTVVVDDVNNCGEVTKEFEIGRDIDNNVTFEVSKEDISCFGAEDGSITVTDTAGGCPNYTIEISGGQFDELGPDTYTITVTDALGNSNTDVVEILEPAELIFGMSTTTKSSAGMEDGSITVTWSGGTAPYMLKWDSDATQIADSMTSDTEVTESGLGAGNYSVTITDDNMCEISSGNIEVMDIIDTGDIKAEVQAHNGMDNNGFDLACFGDMDASIVVNITEGLPNYTAVLSGDTDMTITSDVTTFQFDSLGAGSYNLNITNDAGDMAFDTSFVIMQPEELQITADSGCSSSGTDCDGFIDVEVSGGVETYFYEWDGIEGGPSQDDLCPGFYGVIVTDANDCKVMMQNIEVEDCTGPVEDCYTAALVITPNNDGANEFFKIECIEMFPNVLTIYDRWGRIVYTQNNYDDSWNGLDSDSEELPENAYMWVLEVERNSTETRLFKGTVTLLRD